MYSLGNTSSLERHGSLTTDRDRRELVQSKTTSSRHHLHSRGRSRSPERHEKLTDGGARNPAQDTHESTGSKGSLSPTLDFNPSKHTEERLNNNKFIIIKSMVATMDSIQRLWYWCVIFYLVVVSSHYAHYHNNNSMVYAIV